MNAMRERMPFTIARNILKSAGLDASQGWNRTVERFQAIEPGDAGGRLADALNEHNLCGEKLVKLFAVSRSDRIRVQEILSATDVPASPMSLIYPLPLPKGQVGAGLGEPKLIKIEVSDDGVGAIYSHVVKTTKSEQIPLGEIPTSFREFTDQFQELLGVRHIDIQLFHVVWFPHQRGLVEIRTDWPTGMNIVQAQNAQLQVKRAFESLGLIDLGAALDLYPVLQSIYDTKSEGVVVELAFGTTTASLKHERMRRSMEDLREEPYHVAGKGGLTTKIEPYKLSVRWELEWEENRYQPELSLIGSARGRAALNTLANVPIWGAVVRNCVGFTDFEWVMSRIDYHVDEINMKTLLGEI